MKMKIRNIFSIALIVACVFALTSCKEVEKAEQTFTDFMDSNSKL